MGPRKARGSCQGAEAAGMWRGGQGAAKGLAADRRAPLGCWGHALAGLRGRRKNKTPFCSPGAGACRGEEGVARSRRVLRNRTPGGIDRLGSHGRGGGLGARLAVNRVEDFLAVDWDLLG